MREPGAAAAEVTPGVADASPDRLASVLSSMSAGILTVDRDWQVVFLNPEAGRVLGLGAHQWQGRSLWDLFPKALGSVFETRCRAVMETGEPAEFAAANPEALGARYDVRAWADVDGLSLCFLDVTARKQAETAAARDAQRLRVLADLSTALASTMDSVEAMRLLARLVVPVFADWCVVTLVEDEGLVEAGIAHRDPARLADVRVYAAAQAAQRIPSAPFWTVLRTGEPYLVPEIVPERVAAALPDPATRELFARLNPTSGTGIPIAARGRSLGVLSLWNTGSRPPHSPEEVDTARELGRRAGLAVDNAQLYARQRRMSEVLQRSLLTDPAPLPDLDLAVRYRPAAQEAQIGGDWYDAFRTPDGLSRIAIGDVAGHDREAAALMGQLRNLLRGTAFAAGGTPAAVLSLLDRSMADLTPGSLATAILATVAPTADGAAWTLSWSNAGHPPPLVIGADGDAALLRTEADLLLGLDADAGRSDHVHVLAPGSTVLLYTDGLIERRGVNLDDGFDWLTGTTADWAGLGPDQLCDALLDAVGPHVEDDVALLAFRVLD